MPSVGAHESPEPGASDDAEPGLIAEQYHIESGERTIAAIDRSLSHWDKKFEQLAIRWYGLLRVEVAGAYRFRLTVLGRSDLILDGKTLLELDGTREQAAARQSVSNTSVHVQLQAGDHEIAVRYSETTGLGGVKFEYEGPDSFHVMSVVPPSRLFHHRGPCSLREMPGIDNPPCATSDGTPRWALGDGESCQPRCLAGYYAGGHNGSKVRCHKGRLTPPDVRCEALGCSSPQVENARSPSCEEGTWLQAGDACTPRCAYGFMPSSSQRPRCVNGEFDSSFSCVVREPCNLSEVIIPHAASEGPCLNSDGPIADGETCVSSCSSGFYPTANLTCQNGQFEPSTLFECVVGGDDSLAHLGDMVWRLERDLQRDLQKDFNRSVSSLNGSKAVGNAVNALGTAAQGTATYVERSVDGLPVWAWAGLSLAALLACCASAQLLRGGRRRGRKSRQVSNFSKDDIGSPKLDYDSDDAEEARERLVRPTGAHASDAAKAAARDAWHPHAGRGASTATAPAVGPRQPSKPRILQSSWAPLAH